MSFPNVGDVVELTCDLPESELHRGEVGTVQATWFSPNNLYDVEFESGVEDGPVRALLLGEQIEVRSMIHFRERVQRCG